MKVQLFKLSIYERILMISNNQQGLTYHKTQLINQPNNQLILHPILKCKELILAIDINSCWPTSNTLLYVKLYRRFLKYVCSISFKGVRPSKKNRVHYTMLNCIRT